MKPLTIAMFTILCALQAAGAQQHCGPGKRTFKAPKQLNQACKAHDKAYDRVRGKAKYIPGLGNKAVRKADRKLIRDAAKSVRKAPIRSAAVAGYFSIKTTADAATAQTRKQAQRSAKAAKATLRRVRHVKKATTQKAAKVKKSLLSKLRRK